MYMCLDRKLIRGHPHIKKVNLHCIKEGPQAEQCLSTDKDTVYKYFQLLLLLLLLFLLLL